MNKSVLLQLGTRGRFVWEEGEATPLGLLSALLIGRALTLLRVATPTARFDADSVIWPLECRRERERA